MPHRTYINLDQDAPSAGARGDAVGFLGFDPTAFASSLAMLLAAPTHTDAPRMGAAAAYLCTSGSGDLRDVVRPLSYRFDRVFVLSTKRLETDRWSNVHTLDWRGAAAAFYDALETTGLAPTCGIPSDWDLPAKRTVALQHAREHGFGVGLLIDDDITSMGSGDLDRFRSMENALAGRPPKSSPDLSVIEEMFLVENEPHAFPNGNYLFFDPSTPIGFFPKVYNDDWLFIWSSQDCQPTVLNSGTLTHGARSIDRQRRAAHQEFGETLVKGLCSPQSSPFDQAFWQLILKQRKYFLDGLYRVASVPHLRRIVEAALAMHALITPPILVRWCQAFRADSLRWREHLGKGVRH